MARKQYKPVTTFIGIGQHRMLEAIAMTCRASVSTKDESVSSLVRDALTQYIQALEWLDDEDQDRNPRTRAVSQATTRQIEKALKADF